MNVTKFERTIQISWKSEFEGTGEDRLVEEL